MPSSETSRFVLATGTKRNPARLAALVVASTSLMACQAPAATPERPSRPEAVASAAIPAPAKADPVPQAESIDTDAMMADSALTACSSRDARAFIQAIVFSPAVARRFMAPTLDVIEPGGKRRVTRQAYAGLPIAMMDYSWVTAESALSVQANGPGPMTSVKVEINQSSDNRIAVEWTPVQYEGGDGEGGEARPIGPGGTLLFYPEGDCWNLIEDRRNPET